MRIPSLEKHSPTLVDFRCHTEATDFSVLFTLDSAIRISVLQLCHDPAHEDLNDFKDKPERIY